MRHPHIPPIMLRELLERGVHLDAATLRLLRALPETLGAIVRDGCTRGVFRDVNPFMIYITILSPIVFFLASRPVRQRLSRMGTGEVASVPLDGLIAYVQQLALAGLRTDPGDTSRQPRRRG